MMQDSKYVIFVIGLFILMQVSAQKDHSVVIHTNDSVNATVGMHKDFMNELKTIDGYRVQVYSSTRLQQTMRRKAEFETAFKDLKVYVVFTEPSYRLRIGDFTNKVEAYELMQKLKKKYPEAFIVKDQIKISEL
jgi:sporulation related protein